MATDEKPEWLSAPEEIIVAFEAGIRFGRKMESRNPRREPLWTENEWRVGLAEAMGVRRSEIEKEE
jgi:hypothetical protein